MTTERTLPQALRSFYWALGDSAWKEIIPGLAGCTSLRTDWLFSLSFLTPDLSVVSRRDSGMRSRPLTLCVFDQASIRKAGLAVAFGKTVHLLRSEQAT